MTQLVELGKNKEKFAKAGTEIIAVFREEAKGVDGLKKIKEKTGTTFNLALDNGNKKTGRYSSGNKEFTGYVIDSDRVIRKIIKGSLKSRAKSAELLKAIEAATNKMAYSKEDAKAAE